MKRKSPGIKAICLSILITSGIVLTACSSGSGAEAAVAAPESPLGIYTSVQDFDDVGSRLVGTHAMLGERETVGQLGSLTVYNSATAIQLDENNHAVKDADGEIIHIDNDDENNKFYKYIFAKNSIVAGESFLVYTRGQYTGYCTYDSTTGALMMYTPEYYMTYTTNRQELDVWEGTVTNTKVTDEILAQPTSGLNFSSEWQDFFGYTRPEPMEVILGEDLTFSFVSQYLSDDTGLGNNYGYNFIDYSSVYYGDDNTEGGN